MNFILSIKNFILCILRPVLDWYFSTVVIKYNILLKYNEFSVEYFACKSMCMYIDN